MTNEEYIQNVLKTESRDWGQVKDRLQGTDIVRILHAAIGLTTESGEALDAIKKHVYYGKPLDKVNLIEEAGDIMWYLGILCNVLGVTFEEVQQKNIDKLRARYGEKFSEEAAIQRNLEKERTILEE
jgi:NTP pyrophosphatase (non-canonical NTP hydrolase)